MKRRHILIVAILLILGAVGASLLIGDNTIPVLDPKGVVADRERNLLITASLLSLIVILPVFVLTFYIVWKYRDHKKSKYSPDWDGSKVLETIWWGIPLILILIISGIIIRSSHELDPFKPLETGAKPLNIQVVALQWKWLFIYPEQGIATVNFLQFPEDRPVNFDITSDAPMNSFWIPQLGGQVYAMSGMSTKLHLMASEPGDYRGSSANISGQGFAAMKFTARASSQAEFDRWAESTQRSSQHLTMDEYHTLAKPSQSKEPQYFASAEPGLYNSIVDKYMKPADHEKHEMMGH